MSNVVKFDPFAQMQALQRQFFGDDIFTPGKFMQLPTTDVYTEDDKRLVVEAHLPNFEEKDVDVHLDGDMLVVSAERHEEEKEGKKSSKKYVVRESSSSFYRSIRLPELADQTAISAHMKDGILTVTVPFRELPAPKKIAIEKK